MRFKVESGAERTIARTKMIWTAYYRPERSPRSKIMKSHLEHSWEFRRCAKTGRPFMQGHTVDLFEYLKGFAPRRPGAREEAEDAARDVPSPLAGEGGAPRSGEGEGAGCHARAAAAKPSPSHCSAMGPLLSRSRGNQRFPLSRQAKRSFAESKGRGQK
jgi:hypothetical protein